MSAALPLPACLHLRTWQMAEDTEEICMSCGSIIAFPNTCQACGLPTVGDNDTCETCKGKP